MWAPAGSPAGAGQGCPAGTGLCCAMPLEAGAALHSCAHGSCCRASPGGAWLPGQGPGPSAGEHWTAVSEGPLRPFMCLALASSVIAAAYSEHVPAGMLRLRAGQSACACWARLTDATVLQGVHDKMVQQGSAAAAMLAVRTLLQMSEVRRSNYVAVQRLQ